MTKEKARKIVKREAADKYSEIYADMYKKVARNAFIDGIVFWDMVKAGVVTEDMLNEDFFTVLSLHNHQK
jgi:hypothetical protein